ncbi:hypothetical protein [Wenyingzhuangia aestuarii]|uniref:hypothetical protein n=1 Tax=Wenyingzhuangia aestuarii TaxID=1647582 RepID=UPI00143C9EE5|nr:hypothetical protein [Wenyingzhuangia aestuarii]NJB82185.1 hypothetical protein [Wenyingzhuangia aestuarii]
MKKLIILLISISCFSQTQQKDSFYFNPSEGANFIEILESEVNYSKGEAINKVIQKK